MAKNNWLTMGEASTLSKLTKARLSQLTNTGAVKAATINGRKMIERPSLLSYLEHRKAAGRPKENATGTPFTLMSGPYEIAHVTYDRERRLRLMAAEIIDPARMPVGTVAAGKVMERSLDQWWHHRSVPSTRPAVSDKLTALGIDATDGLPLFNLGLSLSDCYWLRPIGADIDWSDINYFENPFEGSGDLVSAEWTDAIGLQSPDNTSEGELPKRWVIIDGVRTLLKGSGQDDQRPFNEVVATRLYARLLQRHDYVAYRTLAAQPTPTCACADFLNGREEYVPAALLRDTMTGFGGKNEYDRYCNCSEALGAEDIEVRRNLSKTIVCDSILANSDRHWRNFGLIRNIDTLEVRPAPIFDSGNCLWYNRRTAELEHGDYSFVAKPFGPNPVHQLGLVDSVDWLDSNKLDGFVEEAMEVLKSSASVCEGSRARCIETGLTERVAEVKAMVKLLQAR